MEDLRTSSLSVRARLALRTSALALSGATLLAASAASAQVGQATPPNSPNADPTAATVPGSPPSPAVPTPNVDQVQQAQATNAAKDAAGDAAADASAPDIVVTGIRAGLASSAKTKRDATLIVDSVSAEDVGKLPDVSIADSLARLPGVTAQRLDGRDQNLSIRGLGPDFSTTLLNGREQVTAGANRGVEFDQYPSEFFKNVNVYKSADASLIAAGIAGTIDLRTIRPLAVAERVLAVSARAELNEIKQLNPDSPRAGYRASVTYVDKFDDDKLGIAIGLAATQAPTQNERYNAWGYSGSGTAADPYTLGGAKPYVDSELLKRFGGVATIEYQPSDAWHSTFDALYSHFEDTEHLRGIEFPFSFGGATESNVTTNNGFVTGATFVTPYTVQRNDYNQTKSNNLSLGWNNDFRITDRIHFNVDASWSRVTRTDFLEENYTGTGYNKTGAQDTVKVTQNANGTFTIVPTQNYTDTNLFKITDPGGWGYNGTTTVIQSGYLNQPKFTDDLKALRASLNGEFGGDSVVKGWEAGFNYSHRRKQNSYASYFLCPKGGGTNCTVASNTPTSEPIPAGAVIGQVALGYLGVPAVIALNPLYLYNNAYNVVFDNQPGNLARPYVITEDVYTGYGKINFDGLVGGKAFKGNIGLQVVHSDQASRGSSSNLNNGVVTVVPVSGESRYTDFLPSATMSVELVQNGYAKIGVSETMVRPRMDDERISQTFGINLVNIGRTPAGLFPVFSSSGGNINLQPYHSLNIDLSLEKYFNSGGYLAVAGYFKKLTDYVDPNRTFAYDYSAFLSQLTPAQQAAVTAAGQNIGTVSGPANAGHGYLGGVEATASLPFKLITNVLDGFGVFVTGTYTKSEIKLDSNPAVAITLPGLSPYVVSGTAYFEKKGFQARVNYRYRSDFLGEVAGISATPTFRSVNAEALVDAQIGYEFQSGFLKGLAVLAQAKNLTDRPFITYQNNDKRQVIDYQRYGRDYYLGLTYKF